MLSGDSSAILVGNELGMEQRRVMEWFGLKGP